MAFIYNLAIRLYAFLIRIGAGFNPRAKKWINGRKGLFAWLEKQLDEKARYVWFHCASLGEFEQGRPVIEKFRKTFPEYKIILTFFSPSGYEVRKNYDGVDIVCYLPIDIQSHAERFISMVNPELAVFVKYEFWFNYLKKLHRKGIPVFVISAIFREEQHFFKWYGGWFRKQLRTIDHFFVQNEISAKLLTSIGIQHVTISGDTRFDRVLSIAENPQQFPLIEKFTSAHKVLLAGSTWPPEEQMLPALPERIPGLKIIIAPHEIGEDHLKSIEALFKDQLTMRFSQADEKTIDKASVLLIDGIGFLSSLYQYCDVALIGGGFGRGLHNILEAVTFGKPVIFGPNFRKFNEAIELVNLGGGFVVHNQYEFIAQATDLLSNETINNKASAICGHYINKKSGATEIILDTIKDVLPG